MQCPVCGQDDLFGLGFCTSCGSYFKHEGKGPELRDGLGSLMNEPDMTYDQLVRYTISGLVFTVFMGVFILIYLWLNQADLLLILFVEFFPAMWFVLVLLQWRENKDRAKNAK